MTKVSTIRDNLNTLVGTALPSTYIQLPDPYDPNSNIDLFRKQAFGVTIGTALNTQRLVVSKLSIERFFDVLLINAIETTDNNTTARVAAEKAITEDVFAIAKAVEEDRKLGVAANAFYTADDGVNLVKDDKGKEYFTTLVQITVEYFENIT